MAQINLGKVVPEKGVDYWTEEDKQEIIDEAAQKAEEEIDLSGKEDIVNKTNELTSESTTTQYPNAKAVYDYVENIVGDIEDILEELDIGGGV